ncbi:SDR family NAD(P)-dependent oxidoreductase [Nonomuraea dietziae]|uniref:SDR family NAD(P)-dependent oxidoreductase n=1 Tax=Nonomuraea dietziae TaxID=65515 RepID=UPI003389A15D
MSEQTTHQKIALITGANKGIGRAAAEQLAALGMTVLIGARDPRRGEEAAAALRAAGGDAHALTLDVTDQATARTAATQVEERFGHLDVLINNAGITGSGQVSPQDAYDQIPSSVDLDMVRAVFETNVFGVIAVTNAMLPLLRRSPAPRIVNVSSHAASLTLTSDPAGPFTALLPSARVHAVQDRAVRADRAVRQRAAEGRHPGQRRRPRLRRHGQQQPQRAPHPRAGRRSRGAPGNARRGRADRRVLQRGRPCALVMVAPDRRRRTVWTASVRPSAGAVSSRASNRWWDEGR